MRRGLRSWVAWWEAWRNSDGRAHTGGGWAGARVRVWSYGRGRARRGQQQGSMTPLSHHQSMLMDRFS